MSGPAQAIAQALNAYQNAAQGKSMEPRDGPDEGGFADLVKGAIRGAIDTGKESERLSMAAIQDRADINDVVTAVAEAELTLQTVIAVRDKVIEAYQSVLRMPI